MSEKPTRQKRNCVFSLTR